jgi:hypothetical protein
MTAAFTAYPPFLDDLGKDALAWHDTIAYGLEYGTALVAFLAYLGYFQFSLAQVQPRANG